MPDRIKVDELLDRMLFIQKVEEGLLQSSLGQVTSHESFKNEMTAWFKSIGQSGQKEDIKSIAAYISHDSIYYAGKQIERFYTAVEVLL